jgi:transcription termination/antitermination protein NusG
VVFYCRTLGVGGGGSELRSHETAAAKELPTRLSDPINGSESGEALSVMNTSAHIGSKSGSFESMPVAEWYAVRTRPRHEKVVTHSLETAGIETFLPLCPQVRTWSDRRKVVDFPLFPGYIFARTTWSMQARVRIFQTNGVIGFVGPRKEATPIPVQQIDAVRSLVRAQAECRPHSYLAVGQRVRIQNGALQGLQGILVRVASDHSLVVSVDLINRSVAIRLDGYEVEGL